jgi:hypothetical protein
MESNFRRRTIIVLAAAMGVIAFGYRLLTSRSLSNDHYMHMAWAQQLLFHQLPGRDFVDPGMPLMYTLSAAAQWLSPGPFSEVVLSCVLLALAAAATFAVIADLTGSIVVGVIATLFEIALEPRLYSYPKILVPAVALLLIQRYVAGSASRDQSLGGTRPTSRFSQGSLIWLAAWTDIAVLLRHDLGVYAAAGFGAALVVAHADSLGRLIRALVEYAVAVVVIMIPYVVFVQWSEGLAEHLHEAIEFAKGEAHQRFLAPPPFPLWSNAAGLAAWSNEDSAVFLFYAAHVLAIAALVLAIKRRDKTSANAPVVAGGIAMLLLYLVVVLRHPIISRIQDVAALMSIMGAWVVVETGRRAAASFSTGQAAGRFASAVLFIVVLASTIACTTAMWTLGDVSQRLKDTRVADGLDLMERTVQGIRETGTVWPWERFWPAGEVPEAVRYLNMCTSPDDAVLVTWNAPEYYYFARRRFGAGHALFLPPDAFTTEHDQLRMIDRMRSDRLPVVLINETLRDTFAKAYPTVQQYLDSAYAPVGHYDIHDGSRITVAIRRGLKGERRYGAEDWPCGFDSRAASNTASTMLEGSAIPLPAISNAVP